MVRTEKYKYIHCPEEHDELYDLRADPTELNNLANDPAMAGVRAEMKDRLLRWLTRTSNLVPNQWDKRGWR